MVEFPGLPWVMCLHSGPITVTKRMQCADWSDLGHVSTSWSSSTQSARTQEVLDFTSKENGNTVIGQWGQWMVGGKSMTITHNAKQGKFNEKNSLWVCRVGTSRFLETSPVQPSPTH